jgi:hypothetical protein
MNSEYIKLPVGLRPERKPIKTKPIKRTGLFTARPPRRLKEG